MSLAGLDPDMMSVSSKIGGLVFGALLRAVRRGRPCWSPCATARPAGLGRVLLISVAVVHALLGAFAWGLVGVPAFLSMVVVLALIVLLLMTYDRQNTTAARLPMTARAAAPRHRTTAARP